MKRWIVYADQMGPVRTGASTDGTLPVLRRALGKAGQGRKSAWVRCDQGRFPERPGFSKLFFDRLDNPHPWGMPEINIPGTSLIQQADSEPIGARSRLPEKDEWILGFAWLAHDTGRLEDVVEICGSNAAEASEAIYQDWPDVFDLVPDLKTGKTYLIGAFGMDGVGLRESLEGEPDLTPAEIDDYVARYRAFPIEALFRWR